MKRENMIKSAKRADGIMNVLEKVILAGLVLVLAGAVLSLLIPAGGVVTQSKILTWGNISLVLNDSALLDEDFHTWKLVIGLFSAGVVMAVTFVGIRTIRQILHPMKEGSPFVESVPENIKKLARLVLWGGLVSQIAVFLTDILLRNQYENLISLFKDDVVSSVRLNYSFSLTFLFASFILFLLSYVFEYGQQLQKESDETL